MAICKASVTITGISPLLQNNPQTVNAFNSFAKAKKVITAKRSKAEDDLLELADLEMESKLYWDDSIGVYVPSRWLTESVITAAFSVAKISKAKMRGGIFAVEDKLTLDYDKKSKVKGITDIVKNDYFRHFMILPQSGVRVSKYAPIFHKWSSTGVIEYDDTVIDLNTLRRVYERAAKYVGFGDFRPTFGRSIAEVSDVC